jgi:pyruvate formate lyase activating enzyme
VVFFKGCPLRCVFCQNPETRQPGPEIAFSPDACLQCGACAEACPSGAIDLHRIERIDRQRCDGCGACAEACPGNGLRLVGRHYPVQDLCELLLRDRVFYRHSGGGVTLSGGECTLHVDYLEALLKRLKQSGIHVAIETSGYFSYPDFRSRILPYVDLIYYDVKFADPQMHKRYTGKGNERILDNLRRLLTERGVVVRPRIPLVPGLTATAQNLSGIVDILCRFGAETVELLPYNPLGLSTAPRLGRAMPAMPARFMQNAAEEEIFRLFENIVREKKIKGDRRLAAVALENGS